MFDMHSASQVVQTQLCLTENISHNLKSPEMCSNAYKLNRTIKVNTIAKLTYMKLRKDISQKFKAP